MAKRGQKAPKRGPLRSARSRVKIKCGLHKCKTGTDAKNKPYELPVANVNVDLCRTLRSHTKVVKFCCKAHMVQCTAPEPPVKRGGREPLTTPQLHSLFSTLVEVCHTPWAGALMVLQLCLGERADAARQSSTCWFLNMAPGLSDMPTCNIPRVNLKTTERSIPLDRSFANLLWTWMTREPLADQGYQWPFPQRRRRNPPRSSCCLQR